MKQRGSATRSTVWVLTATSASTDHITLVYWHEPTEAELEEELWDLWGGKDMWEAYRADCDCEMPKLEIVKRKGYWDCWIEGIAGGEVIISENDEAE